MWCAMYRRKLPRSIKVSYGGAGSPRSKGAFGFLDRDRGIVAMSEVWRRLEPLPGNRAACELFLQRDEPACEFKSRASSGERGESEATFGPASRTCGAVE